MKIKDFPELRTPEDRVNISLGLYEEMCRTIRILQTQLESAKDNYNFTLRLLEKLGIPSECVPSIYPDTVTIELQTKPVSHSRTVIIKFDMEINDTIGMKGE